MIYVVCGVCLIILGIGAIARRNYSDGRNDYERELRQKQSENDEFTKRVLDVINKNK